MMHYLLALETSSPVCSVALLCRDRDSVTVHARAHEATAEHAERLLPMVDAVLADSGITASELGAVAFGQGPGGFTGLRVACGVAQGMAFGLGVNVVPVDSLAAVVQRYGRGRQDGGHPQGGTYVVVQDARMNEAYLGIYQRDEHPGGIRTVQPPLLIAVADIVPWLERARDTGSIGRSPTAGAMVLGDALQAFPDLVPALHAASFTCAQGDYRADAQAVAELGYRGWLDHGGIVPDQAAPLYVRDKVAFTTREREHGRGGNPKAPVPGMLDAMTTGHLDQVCEIERRVQSHPWTYGNFADALNAGYGAWVVRRGDDVAGFCLVMFAPDVAHLLVIAVKPEEQGSGLGAQLLAHTERQARQRGVDAVLLEVRPSNTRAVAFYKAHGYTQIGVRKDYYPAGNGKREDACVFQKALA